MKKIAIGSWAFLFNQERPTADFHELLHHVANLGYDGIELGAFAPHPTPEQFDTSAKRRDLAKMIRDHGLELACLTPDLWSHKLVSVDNAGPLIEAFTRAVEFAVDLGVRVIRLDTVEPTASLPPGGVEPARLLDRAVAGFAACAQRANDHGVTVAWEFEPGFPLHTPHEIDEVAHRVRDDLGRGNFGVLFNTAHAYLCAGGAVLELFTRLAGRIVHVHLGDTDGTLNEHRRSRQVPLGRGVLSFEQLLPALAAGVPSEWWTIDLCFWPDAWQAAADSKRALERHRRKLLSSA